MTRKVNRREFAAVGLAASLAVTRCARKPISRGKRVLVLGIDGLDPLLLQQYLAAGVMPNFARLIQQGGFSPLGTTIPPQSPVAWSSFTTGMNPGRHGIYDFIHRHPEHRLDLYLSTSRTVDPPENRSFTIGKQVIWLAGGKVELLRQGRPFWEYLEDHDIPVTVYKIPAEFPPRPGRARVFSGMGTPDLLGTYGTFSYYTDNPPANAKEVSGGEVYPTFPKNGVAEMILHGPKNTFRLDPKKPYLRSGRGRQRNYAQAELPFRAFLDPEHAAAKIEIAGSELVLNQGEWSGWVPIAFELSPAAGKLRGMVRFYLKEVRPDFKLYVSPINIDPMEQALPISNPPDYGRELARAVGRFYTQGISEDNKARTNGILDDAEYWKQSQDVLGDSLRLYRYHLEHFDRGFLFFYFSALDLGQHMFWRLHDPKHPSYDHDAFMRLQDPLRRIYMQMDEVLGQAGKYVDAETTLIVLSDHGFASFARNFQLNSWLLDNGYLYLRDRGRRQETEYFDNVDWGRTRAYGLGINGLYLNLYGREWSGMVMPGAEREALLRELKERLEAVVDPETGEHPIRTVYRADQVYRGPWVEKLAPDLIIGYARGWRASWETTLGEFPEGWFSVNREAWSGDHCIAAEEVPGTLVANRKIAAAAPSLIDLGPTILAEFGIQPPAEMEGRPVF